MIGFRLGALAVVLALVAPGGGIAAQAGEAFLDAEARALHAAARARWREVDRSLVRYQAVVSQRIGVGLRLPLRDRTLFHREAAARVIWERRDDEDREGGVTAVQLLAHNAPPQREMEDGDGRRSCAPSSCASSMRVEGTLRAGLASAPVVGEIGYELEDVVVAADGVPALGVDGSVVRLAALAAADGGEWRIERVDGERGRRVSYIVPADSTALARSPLLPQPVWSEDRAFVRPAEIHELAQMLADVAGPMDVATVATFDWGMQRPDLIRYNRVEGISLGARASVRFGLGGSPVAAALTARLGSADLEPRGTLVLSHETLDRSLSLSGFRDLQLADPSTRGLGIGSSLNALLFGRDDGDYYQATGAALVLAPPTAERVWYRARAYAERQEPVARETHQSLLRWVGWDRGFRAATPAARADQAGVELKLMPWWGRDPLRPGAGVQLELQAERGSFDFERARLGGRAALPLPLGSRLALAAAAGATWGAAPPQRLWTLGGPFNLRGFSPGALVGPAFLSGRAEIVVPLRPVSAARAVGLAVFMDGGWAGDRTRIRWDAAAASAGVGLSILDGVLRLDGAWSWHGPEGRRLELYLDGLL